MRKLFANIRDLGQAFASRITLRRDNAPIDSIARLNDFVSTRSAYIAQKTLYGYLKTRMGTRYPTMFEDEIFLQSINIAKFHVFAACLSDLAIHAIARATENNTISDETRCTLAADCLRSAMAENMAHAPDAFASQPCIDDFTTRLQETDWLGVALLRENFTSSPAALVEWAPIAPELKRYDKEIVENSIKFAWQDIRKQLDQRLDRAMISGELTNQ